MEASVDTTCRFFAIELMRILVFRTKLVIYNVMLLEEIVWDIHFLLGLEIDIYLIGTSMSPLSSGKSFDAITIQEIRKC